MSTKKVKIVEMKELDLIGAAYLVQAKLIGKDLVVMLHFDDRGRSVLREYGYLEPITEIIVHVEDNDLVRTHGTRIETEIWVGDRCLHNWVQGGSYSILDRRDNYLLIAANRAAETIQRGQ